MLGGMCQHALHRYLHMLTSVPGLPLQLRVMARLNGAGWSAPEGGKGGRGDECHRASEVIASASVWDDAPAAPATVDTVWLSTPTREHTQS